MTAVIETALNGETTEHLGYKKMMLQVVNSNRFGLIPWKAVLKDSGGAIAIEVPTNRAGIFEPRIVNKRLRRYGEVD